MSPTPTHTAVITGASSGIGRAFAYQLAARGLNLLLVARRRELLDTLAREVQEKYSAKVVVCVADLATEQGLAHVEQQIRRTDDLLYLINNAGFGTPGLFADIPLEKSLAMLRVHVEAPTRFCWAALQGMRARNRGVIINVSSLAAFLPVPSAATYCATKTYLNTFSLALQTQLQSTAIKVQALCPGFTYSGFHDTPEYAHFSRSKIPTWVWMTAEEVAISSLRALNKKAVIVVPGFQNRILAWFMQTAVSGAILKIIGRYRPH